MRLSFAALCALIVPALLSSCGGSSTPTTPPAVQQNQSRAVKHSTSPCPCLYVGNAVHNAESVTVYAAGANGNARPIQDISGSNTGLDGYYGPDGIAVDGSGNVYVSLFSGVVYVYAAGATGNVAPIQTISGSYTGLSGPEGVALDPVNGDLYVANYYTGSLTIYPPGANGNVAPIGTIAGASTGIDLPFALTLDASGNIYVATCGTSCSDQAPPPSLLEFAAGSVGNVAPMHTISGTRTRLYTPYGVAVDSSSNVYAAHNGNFNFSKPYGVTIYAAGANGDVRPVRTISGELDGPGGIAVDNSGNTYVANYHNNSITVYAPGANGKVVPIYKLKGKRTGLANPRAIAVR